MTPREKLLEEALRDLLNAIDPWKLTVNVNRAKDRARASLSPSPVPVPPSRKPLDMETLDTFPLDE